jgi:hypothetical protein
MVKRTEGTDLWKALERKKGVSRKDTNEIKERRG